MSGFALCAAGALDRFRSSPAGPYVDGFAGVLCERGYSRKFAVSIIGDAVHLGRWAEREGRRGIAALDEKALEAFLAHLPACRCPGRRGGRPICVGAHARAFVDYLRDRGVVALAAPQPAREPALVKGFCDWMRRHRGVTQTTLHNYGRVAGALVARLGEEPSRYDAAGLRAAVHEVGGGRGVGTAKSAATVARAFVRYLAMEGRCRPGLDAAIVPVANWSLAALPRYVSADTVQKIIDAGSSARRCGARDRAILLLLARLGLRGDDIVRMRLSDIDWSGARVCVAGKGRREVRLPLPQEVGDAILAYLRAGRSTVASDRVFLRVRAPRGPLGGCAAVTQIVRRAIERAGVSTPTHGSNLLRHSLATAMLREGISLPAIGIVLRHRSPQTTAHYAKVDVEMLRAVAQLWIGGTPC